MKIYLSFGNTGGQSIASLSKYTKTILVSFYYDQKNITEIKKKIENKNK